MNGERGAVSVERGGRAELGIAPVTRLRSRPFDAPRSTLHALLLLALAACSGSDRPPGELRFRTDRYALRVSSDPAPPRARTRTLYKVVITDRESGRPIEKAEGQVYASNKAGTNIYDALTAGPELGTYYATLRFITAEEWALNLRFRGTPGDTIETVAPDGWRQNVAAPAQ